MRPNLLNKNSEKLKQKTAVALGMFDGVHLGHQAVIKKATDYARAHNLASAVVTLRNHPRQLTKAKAPKLITNLDSRLKNFAKLGVDHALVLDFDHALMNTEPDEYLEKYLQNILNVAYVSSGYDHHFGKNRSGSPQVLESWCQEHNLGFDLVEACTQSDKTISSSNIRDLIEQGQIEKANKMLGYDFLIIANVVEGDKRGRTIGFPTANLLPPHDMVKPLKGVYSGEVELESGEKYPCVTNIGTRPSFTDSDQVIAEAHILNFDQDIYGQKLELSLKARIRDEKKFASIDELIDQIQRDIALCYTN